MRKILFRAKRIDNGEFVEGSLVDAIDGCFIFGREYNAIHEDPEYHSNGMGCGLEDRNIIDRYEAMAHGWDCALERIVDMLPEYIEVDRSTVCQYTGLEDKRGTKIFEGDILRRPPREKWEESNFVSFEVFYHDNDCADRHIGFQMNRLHFHGAVAGHSQIESLLPKWAERLYIIGNIHENSDQL